MSRIKKKKRGYKKHIILFIFVIGVAIGSYFTFKNYYLNNNLEQTDAIKKTDETNKIKSQNTLNNKDNTSLNSNKDENKNKDTIPVSSNNNIVEIDKWYLMLVNKNNPIPNDYKFELSNIDSSRQFDSRAIKYLTDMINEMKKDGCTVWAQSTYRSIELQQGIYDRSINTYMSYGNSREKAEELTLREINKPGTSEHNLGLAVDFNNIDDAFENTKAFAWLGKNAAEYGFVLRYPKDKENVTFVKYEPWHYRYVTKQHATAMKNLGMCLEEYIEYLKGSI